MNIFDKIKTPPKEYSPAAFWFWYGDLNPDELRRQIGLMAEQGVYNGFMHPRAYLNTPYLEDEWWEAVSACVDEGNRCGFFSWIYDEYAWPSGTAGSTFAYGCQKPSRTLAKGRKNMAKSLVLRRFASVADFNEQKNADEDGELLCAFCGNGSDLSIAKDGFSGDGEILAFYVKVHPSLVDYLNKDTIREFINYTHEEYKKRYGEHFGERIPGVFFDEIYLNHFLPWTDRFPEKFKARRGYDIMPLLYALASEGGEREREIRRDFYKTVAELYEEAFFAQIGDWCEDNGLRLTGHTEEDLLFHPARQGNYFNTVRHLQIPGADCHDYRYRYPRRITYREPKLAVSVARAYGKERAMSEAFGGAGWACTLEEFKRGVNTAGAMGISMFTLHGFYSEIDHQGSQSDWPGNFFFQNPYWRYFRHFADYISRVCYVNSLGAPIVDVAIYYPIEEMQRETYARGITKAGKAIDAAFNTVLNRLIENQIDVDIVDGESIMRADIKDGRLCVGNGSFSLLLLPDAAVIGKELSERLDVFQNSGGRIVYYATQKTDNDDFALPEEIARAVADAIRLDATVICGERDDLFINHRRIDGREFYFVANSAPRARELTLLLRATGGAKGLRPEDGELFAVKHQITDKGTVVELSLDCDEGIWIVIDPEEATQNCESRVFAEEIEIDGDWELLPLSSHLSAEDMLAERPSELKIPIATFSSELHGEERQIRIQNKEGELGHVGRHLSLWQASWITRRVGWKDGSNCNRLFFRRDLHLDKNPDSARICLSAINEWSLYINGEAVGQSKNGRAPTSLDISAFLRKGDNNICVSVYNPTPLAKGTLLEREELLPELLISLIAEIELSCGEEKQIICTDSRWIVCESAPKSRKDADFKPTVFSVDPAMRSNQAPALKATEWSYAWERGKPPMKPFGDMPLFDNSLSYPQRVFYGVELPSGTVAVNYPSASGENIEIFIDGETATFDNGRCCLSPDGKTHHMQISIMAHGENDGLKENVTVTVAPQSYELEDWRLHGLKWHSGFARYKKRFSLTKGEGRYILDLGRVCHQAEVYVNGKKAGERVWEPYRLDITELLRDGDNEISVIVSNSAGVWHQFALLDEGEALGWNRYWNFDNIQRDAEKLISGLVGPVKITRQI